jgi:ABC-type sugar transport system permease subunit
MLSHVLAFTSVFLFLDACVLFEGAYILLGGSGGTLDAGLLLVAYTYQTAFTLGRFGSAAAMGFSMVPLLMIAVWLLLLRGRGRAERSRAAVARDPSAILAGPVGGAHG